MAWRFVGHIKDLYTTYKEYQDNRRMAELYPYNQDYKDRVIVLSDILDIMAFGIAKDWAEDDEPISMYTTHLRSLCYHLYRNGITVRQATAMYLSHYRDGDKWAYRDGTNKHVIITTELPKEFGCPLLMDRPSSIYEDW